MQYKWWLIPIASVALSGCLKQLGLETDDKTAEATSAIAGKAADGYLAGAVVCLDLNENKECDPGEPQTTTGAGGSFTISATAAQAAKPLLVEVIPGETIDEDNPDTPITEAYSLSAPAGYTFISPLTTLVQNEIESNGSNAADAKAAIQALLGTVLDLEDDYVAGSNVDDSAATAVLKDEFERLHKVAQVAATIIRVNVAGTADTTGISTEAKLQLISNKVTAALADIKDAVDNAGDSFDPSEIASSDEIDAQTKVDPEKIAEEIEVAATLSTATKANIATALESGVYWLEEHAWFDYGASASQLFFGWGSVTYNGTEQGDEFYYYDGTGVGAAAFTADTSSDSGSNNDNHNNALVLSSSGWGDPVNMDGSGNGPDFVSANTDGSVTMQQGPIQVTLTGVQVAVENKNIEATLANTRNNLWADAVSSTATFPAGSIAYRLNQVLAADVYLMPWDQPAVSENDYSNCQAEEAVGTTTDLKSCNSVHVFDGANPDGEGAAADTVSLTVGAAGTLSNPASFKGVVIYNEDDEQGTQKMVLMEMVTGGVVNYYKFARNTSDTFTVTKIRSDKFSSSSVNGKTLVQIPVPFDIPTFFTEKDENGGDGGPQFRNFFLTKYDGFWRFGVAFKKGEKLPDDAPFVMNETAKNAVVNSFDPDNINNFIDPVLVQDGQSDSGNDGIKPCFNGDSKNNDKNFDNYAASLSGCRSDLGTTDSFDTAGGFSSELVSDMSFFLPIYKDMVFDESSQTDVETVFEEKVTFSATDNAFTLQTYIRNADGTETLDETRTGTWSIDSDGYLVVAIGSDEKAWVGLVENADNYLSVKLYDLNTTDGGAADLDNTDGESDGEVVSMIWRKPISAPIVEVMP